jgi:predicted nucleic acid-binding protein
MRLVADTGPILHLQEAGALDLLPLVGEIVVPPLVLAELSSLLPTSWQDAPPRWLTIQSLSVEAQQQALAWRQAGLLHGGESEALALARQLKPDWFLTDDAAARLMADSLGIEAHGSLGVVLWAAGQKLIGKSAAENHLAGLERSSLWTSPRVRAEARIALAGLFT